MIRYSVKKPFTVLVAVAAIIVFGVISYIKMVPDLLPSMDYPYVVVVTTYPGAAPEEVEMTVTKPMEQSMATLNNIKTLTSTSNDNYSMLILEFEQETDMNGAVVDILQATQQLEGRWDDSVGTPTIIRINPNMVPVMVAALDSGELDRYELCRLANENIIPELEGTTGLASVTSAGLVEREVTLSLNDSKVDAVNADIKTAMEKSMQEALDKLNEAQDELNDATEQVEKGMKQLTGASASSLNMKIDTGKLKEFLSDAAITAVEVKTTEVRLKALEAEKNLYETNISTLKNNLNDTKAAIAEIDSEQELLSAAITAGEGLEDTAAVSELALPQEQLDALAAKGINTLGEAKGKNAVNIANREVLSAAAKAAENAITDAENAAAVRMPQLETDISTVSKELQELQKTAKEQADKVAKTQAGLEALPSKLMKGITQISVAGGQLAAAQTALNSAQEQLDAAFDTYEDQVEAALKAADMHNILTLETLCTIIGAQNFDMPAGYAYDEDGNGIIVSVGDKLQGLADLENLVLMDLGLEGLKPVRLCDVADVVISDNSAEIYATLNGSDSLILMFSKQSNFATASVTDNLLDKFAEIEAKYPGVHFSPLMNQGEYIYLIRDSILSSLLWGALFSVLILFLFLRDWRPTVITLCSIPISLLLALALMYFTGISINIMSLSGLAVSVGMLVDNSVVVIENTYRLRNLGENTVKSAVSGAGQVAGAVAASTLTTVCVFAPIVFLEGLTKELFTDMVLTLAYALLASLAVSVTVVPALASTLLKKAKPFREGAFAKLMPAYRRSVSWGVEHKAIVILLALLLLAGSVGSVLIKGFSFLPDMEMDQMMVYLTMPEGSSFEETTEMADAAASLMSQVEGVETVAGVISDDLGSVAAMASTGDVTYYVILADGAPKPGKVAKAITEACSVLDCEVKADASSIMGTMTEMMSGTGITVRVYGNDLNELQHAAETIADAFAEVEGIGEITGATKNAASEIHFTVNREKAAAKGLTVAQVYMQVATALSCSMELTEINDGGNVYTVIVRTMENSEITPEYIKNLEFTVTDSKTGEEKTVALRDVTDFTDETTPASINRLDQRRYLNVTGHVLEGYNVTKVNTAVQAAMSQLELPADVRIEYSGENEAIMDAMKQLVELLLVGILLVYLVMVAQFQNLKAPFIVMFTVPLAFTGGFLALFICGMELSVLSMLGMIMLVGIIVNNGIVLVDYINQLRENGMERREAIAEAAVTRLRPILMTSITTILGLFVMSLGRNEATAFIQPLAITCIGGLTYGTLLTLYVVPVMYDIFSKKELLVIAEEDLELSRK